MGWKYTFIRIIKNFTFGDTSISIYELCGQIPSSVDCPRLCLNFRLLISSVILYLFELKMCDADEIRSTDVATMIIDYLKESKNSDLSDLLFTGITRIDHQIAIKGNKLYFGGRTS